MDLFLRSFFPKTLVGESHFSLSINIDKALFSNKPFMNLRSVMIEAPSSSLSRGHEVLRDEYSKDQQDSIVANLKAMKGSLRILWV